MEKSHEVLKNTFSSLGAKRLAKEIGVARPTIYKWSEPKAGEGSGQTNPLDTVLEICNTTGDNSPAKWLCEKLDGFFVKNYHEDIPITEPLKATSSILKEFSEMLSAITDSYKDCNIDPEESVSIRKEWNDVKTITEAFVCACEKGVFQNSNEK